MNISVYLGSSPACKEIYNTLSFELGARLADAGHTIVYGGADVGTMKFLADGALSRGGSVIGVFPRGFMGTVEVRNHVKKLKREDLTEMIDVADFSERKKVMEERGDCCVVMPGSYGTLDELFTYACDCVIGKHSKRIFLLNYEGYYEPLRQLTANMAEAGFLKPSTVGLLQFVDTVDDLLVALGKED